MIFLLCLLFGGLLLTWWLEESDWEERLWIRKMIRESRESERRRRLHRGVKYTQCGWKPPKMKRRRFKPTALRFHRNTV